MDLLNLYTRKILDSWTALRLGLNQESGGPNTKHKVGLLYENLPQVVTKLKHEDEITDFLEDYLDDELNIICEDNSHEEVAHLIYEGLLLFRNKNMNELQDKINNLTDGCDINLCQPQIQPTNDAEDLTETDSISESEGDIDMN
ncbi:Pre rRNA processing TSR2 region [Schistosoma japonicum]|uniref:Pre-rRNA-processing protein TSR2 homolog n=1 Tax=Schistosoma japonicum TaxID=6182 RepID=A0A4Z2DIS7_SCHJA|nr:Pre rRNA processing TSR2 region [Schistosoma japonicum]